MPKRLKQKRPGLHAADLSKTWSKMRTRHCCSHRATLSDWMMFVRKTDTCIADGLAPVIAIVRRSRLDWQQLLSGLLGGGGDAESLGAHTPQTGGGSSASTACQALQGPVNVREVQGEGVAGSFRHGTQAL